MGFFKNLFCKKKKTPSVAPANQSNAVVTEMLYYINIPVEDFKTNEFGEIVRDMKDEVYGPFSLQELKSDYPILEDTLISTDTLNGKWYEARCFECFDELFKRNQGFYINEFGEIVKTKKK
jgi:hypothetical protein